jgi:hypothetical protein
MDKYKSRVLCELCHTKIGEQWEGSRGPYVMKYISHSLYTDQKICARCHDIQQTAAANRGKQYGTK